MRGADVFVVQTHYEPVNEAIMEQLIMIDAMKRASAPSASRRSSRTTATPGRTRRRSRASRSAPSSSPTCCPPPAPTGWSRSTCTRGQIQGFFDCPVRPPHGAAAPVVRYLKDELGLHGDDLVVVAPDAGRIKTAETLREYLHADLAFLYKRRSRTQAHKIEEMAVVGEVEGRPCVLVDDMIDTAARSPRARRRSRRWAPGRSTPAPRTRSCRARRVQLPRGGPDRAGDRDEHGPDPRREAVLQAPQCSRSLR